MNSVHLAQQDVKYHRTHHFHENHIIEANILNYFFPRADLANTAKKKDVRDRASAFWNALEPISDEFNKIEAVQLAGA